MKTRIKRALAYASATALLSAPASAEEFRLDRLFVVGDSLSDGGAYSQSTIAGAALAGQMVPNIRYKFTDNAPDGSSKVYAEVLADELGIAITPNIINGVPAAAGTAIDPLSNDVNVGGNNFAQGGSRVTQQPGVNNNPAFGITTVPVSEQVDRLLAATPTLNDRDLVIVWGGNNDILVQAGAVNMGLPAATAGANIVQAAGELVAQVDRLKAAGASNIVVVTVPDIGANTPFGAAAGPAGAAGLSSLVNAFNGAVATGLQGRNAAIVDSDKLLTAVLNDPTRYGFSNINQRITAECTTSAVQCIRGVNTLSDGNARVFADPVHPTTRAHALFGQAAHAGLIAATQNGVIPVAILSAIRQQSLGLENRLNLGAIYKRDETGKSAHRPVGDFEIYGGGELGFYESDAEQIRPGLSATTQVVKVAADVAVAPGVVVGAGISLDHGQVDFDESRGGFDSRLVIGGLFGVAEIIKGVYVNATLGYGMIDVTDINRNFQLGPARESYDSSSDGSYFVAKGGVGAMLPIGDSGFVVNPSVGFAFEKVDIDGYDESAGGASLSYGDVEFEAHRLTLALGGYYRPPSAPSWVFGLRGSYEHDFNNDDVEVTFGPDRNRLATLGAPRPDGDFGYLSATVTKEITPQGSLTLLGSTVVGLDGVDGYTASLVYKQAF